jgi:hypothetical protein
MQDVMSKKKRFLNKPSPESQRDEIFVATGINPGLFVSSKSFFPSLEREGLGVSSS